MSYPDVEFPPHLLDPECIAKWQTGASANIAYRGGVESLNADSKLFYAMEYRASRARSLAYAAGWKPYPERSWRWNHYGHCMEQMYRFMREAESRPDYVPLEDA